MGRTCAKIANCIRSNRRVTLPANGGPVMAKLLRTLLLAAFACSTNASAWAQSSDEKEMGAQVYQQLKDDGQILASSPLYDTLHPIAQSITRVVQPQYPSPKSGAPDLRTRRRAREKSTPVVVSAVEFGCTRDRS